MKNIENKERRNPIMKLMQTLEELNEKKSIYNLSITSSGMNDPINYTHVSFKIPRKQ